MYTGGLREIHLHFAVLLLTPSRCTERSIKSVKSILSMQFTKVWKSLEKV